MFPPPERPRNIGTVRAAPVAPGFRLRQYPRVDTDTDARTDTDTPRQADIAPSPVPAPQTVDVPAPPDYPPAVAVAPPADRRAPMPLADQVSARKAARTAAGVRARAVVASGARPEPETATDAPRGVARVAGGQVPVAVAGAESGPRARSDLSLITSVGRAVPGAGARPVPDSLAPVADPAIELRPLTPADLADVIEASDPDAAARMRADDRARAGLPAMVLAGDEDAADAGLPVRERALRMLARSLPTLARIAADEDSSASDRIAAIREMGKIADVYEGAPGASARQPIQIAFVVSGGASVAVAGKGGGVPCESLGGGATSLRSQKLEKKSVESSVVSIVPAVESEVR